MDGYKVVNFAARISSPRVRKCQTTAPLTRYQSLSCLTDEFFSYLDEMCKEMNIYWNGDHLAEKVRIAGFENVTHKKIKIRVGNWGEGKLP